MGDRLRVGVLGCGNVGAALCRLVVDHADIVQARAGTALEIVAVAVRDLAKVRDVPAPPGVFTTDPAQIVKDPAVDIVVEVMGAVEPARTLILEALAAGKPVVTANKELLASHATELLAAAEATGVDLLFEASVGGGIPLIRPLRESLAGDRIRRVLGIVNGTTNYILSAMTVEGRAYEEVLDAAKAAGYAEADPAGDVEGDDAVNKLVILIRLAFGVWVDPADVVRLPPIVASGGLGRPGITGVTASDIAGATALDATIKLIADASRSPDGRVSASVLPTVVGLADPMGRTNGVTNRVEIRADPLGEIAFVGPGAGGGATSSAILGDLLAVVRGIGSTWAGLPPAAGAGPDVLHGPPDRSPDGGWFAVAPDGIATIVRAVSLEEARSTFRAAGLGDGATILPADIARGD
jgi:homoserine dehydrogenase